MQTNKRITIFNKKLPWSQNTERIRSLTVKSGGLTEPLRYHAAIVRYQSSLVILAVQLRLNTAQKRSFTMQYMNKTLVFSPFTVVYDDL